MDASRRATIILGLALVVVGGLALLGRYLQVDLLGLGWPVFVIVPGIALVVAGLAVGGKPGLGLAIPGGIVTMAGSVLAFQSATGLYGTWAYAWALVAPGGVGLAMVLYGVLTRQSDIVRGGMPVLLTGVGLFIGFGLFFEGVLDMSGAGESAQLLIAAAVLALGVVVVLYGLAGPRGRSPDRQSTETTR